MRLLLAVCMLLLGGSLFAAQTAPTVLDDVTLRTLARLAVGDQIVLDAFPVGPGKRAAVGFQRIEIYAPGARMVEISSDGERELPRSTRVHLLGDTADGTTRIVLSYDPSEDAAPHGAGTGPSGAFELRGARSDAGWQLVALDPQEAMPAGVVPEFIANDDSMTHPHSSAAPSGMAGLDLRASAAAGVAVIAVDTDNEWLSSRFNNNTAQAIAWSADLFAQLNLIYQRDLNVVLQQGTTFLRIAPDPYTTTGSPASSTHLDEFGTYWQNNYSSSGGTGVPRAFAMLLSGKSASGNSASGIAWLNSYCRTPSYGGSYSVVQAFTNPSISVAQSAFIVAHELGHNFGAAHTHCTNASTGDSPNNTNTIDQCFSGEGNCYTGVTSCPVSGPAAPKGTLMSYCHISSAGCGPNVQQFHPTHITRLRGYVAQNTASCLRPDTIFRHGFQ